MDRMILFLRDIIIESIFWVPGFILIDRLIEGHYDIFDSSICALFLCFIFNILNHVILIAGFKRIGIQDVSLNALKKRLHQSFNSSYNLEELKENLKAYAQSHKMEQASSENQIVFLLKRRKTLISMIRPRQQIILKYQSENEFEIWAEPKPFMSIYLYRCISFIEQLKALIKENHLHDSYVNKEEIFL